jgi:hypothetical protein
LVPAAEPHRAAVGRAAVDGGRLVVRPEQAVGWLEQVQVRGVRRVAHDPAGHPAFLVSGAIENQALLVVFGVHDPGQLQLLGVVEALDALGLALGLG